jgi:hypothetical protein
LVIVVYYGNSGVEYYSDAPSLNDSFDQSWQYQSDNYLRSGAAAGGAQIGLRMWWTAFNGSWNDTISFNSAPTADAQGAGILVYRMGDPFATISLNEPPSTSDGGNSSITTRNGYTLSANSNVTLLKYNTFINQTGPYLSIIFVCGGSTSSTTPISLNVTTNNGWAQDTQWTYANSGYSIVRVYSIQRANNFEPDSTMPSFVFNRTNGGGHGIVGLVFYKV